MSDKKIFSLDRTVGELAVCISDDDDQVIVPLISLGGLEVRDIFAARIDGESLSDIEPMPEERDKRMAYNRALLDELARRSKNKS